MFDNLEILGDLDFSWVLFVCLFNYRMVPNGKSSKG